MDYICHYHSPLGAITVAARGEAVTGLWFDGQKYDRDTLSGEYQEMSLPVFSRTATWLDLYFAGEIPDFTPPLALDGSPFRREVWALLLRIPYGKTVTYGELARELAERRGVPGMSAQAVGGAVGHNPISLIIPCHRVLDSRGSLTGYAGGVDKKAALLALERAGC